MSKYVCSICGYVYDEELGDNKNGISPNTLWKDVPNEWKCPLCNAPKDQFNKEADETDKNYISNGQVDLPDEVTYTNGELCAIFSNLSKGFEKQYSSELSKLCMEISNLYQSKEDLEKVDLDKLKELTTIELDTLLPYANRIANEAYDRGSLRALKWATLVSKMSLSHIDKLIDNNIDQTNVYVCEICGFIYLGDNKPEICPVCKVPNFKMTEIERGA